MKKTLLLTTALLSLNCHATDLVLTPVLIEHIDKMPVIKTQTKSATCTASASAGSGYAGNLITVFGNVTYTIYNTSGIQQNYWIDEYMCINGFGCTHGRFTTTVAPNGIGNGGGQLRADEYVASKGTYTDQATIQITGESTCFVQGSNSVFVY
jgi:hypothetical protein